MSSTSSYGERHSPTVRKFDADALEAFEEEQTSQDLILNVRKSEPISQAGTREGGRSKLEEEEKFSDPKEEKKAGHPYLKNMKKGPN